MTFPKLENAAMGPVPESLPSERRSLYSLAVSLKRLADAAEALSHVEQPTDSVSSLKPGPRHFNPANFQQLAREYVADLVPDRDPELRQATLSGALDSSPEYTAYRAALFYVFNQSSFGRKM